MTNIFENNNLLIRMNNMKTKNRIFKFSVIKKRNTSM